MKKHYLFAPIIVLIILIVTFLSSYSYGQSKPNEAKLIKVEKHIKSNSDNSENVEIEIRRIVDENSSAYESADSVINIYEKKSSPNGVKRIKVIEITNGDTVITNCWNDSLASIWVQKFETDRSSNKIQKRMVFISDTSMDLEYDFEFDTIMDPLNHVKMKFVDGGEAIEKEFKILMQHPDSNMIFINDDGENIKIERKGEMVFINKKKNIKNMDSLMEIIEDEDGQRVVVIQTRIVLDELTKNEEKELKAKGLKTSNREPDFDYVRFSPNPSKNEINLNFKLTDRGTTQVKISNMLGQTVFEEKLNNFEGEYSRSIGLMEHGPGTYILQIIQRERVISRKIIIE